MLCPQGINEKNVLAQYLIHSSRTCKFCSSPLLWSSYQTSRFVSNLGKITTEHIKGLNGNEAPSHTSVSEWCQGERDRHDDSKDAPKGSAAIKCSISRISCDVHEMVARDCQMALKLTMDLVHFNRRQFIWFFIKIWNRGRSVWSAVQFSLVYSLSVDPYRNKFHRKWK